MTSPAPLRRRLIGGGVAMLCVTTALVSLPLRAAAAAPLVTEGFTNTQLGTPADWNDLPDAAGNTGYACLTAATSTTQTPLAACPAGTDLATADANGDGALRLTDATGNLSGGVAYNQPIDVNDGINLTFDQYQYGGTGADGITFYLATALPARSGVYGGHLGYSGGTAAPAGNGLPDGYIGIGLDVYGNYLNPAYEGTGCTDPTDVKSGTEYPNQVTVRGTGDIEAGYCLLSSSYEPTTGGLGWPANSAGIGGLSTTTQTLDGTFATTRASVARLVNVTINKDSGAYVVSVDFTGTGNDFVPVTSGTLPLVGGVVPSTLYAGWTASTGGSTDVHEINNFAVNLLPEIDSTLTDSGGGTLTPGAAGQSMTLSTSIDSAGGPESMPLTSTETLPSGETLSGSPSGTGWACTGASGDSTFTCVYSPSAQIAPGTALPAVSVPIAIASSSTGTLVNTVTTDSVDAQAPVTATDTITLAPESNIGTTQSMSPTNPISGQTVTYTITASNSGPSDATDVSLVDDVPSNLTDITGVSPDCVYVPAVVGPPTSGGTITCTPDPTGTAGVLTASGPDNSEDFSFTGTVPSSGTLTNTTSITQSASDTDPNLGNNASNSGAVPVDPSSALTIGLSDSAGNGTTITAGSAVSYTVTVTNAGPSTGTGVVVSDTSPLDNTTAATTDGSCSLAGDVVTCTAATLGVTSETITISGTAPASGPISDTASVTSSSYDANATPPDGGTIDSNTASNNVTPEAAVTNTVTSNPSTPVAGQSVTFDYPVTNAGPSVTTITDLNIPIPAGLTGVSITDGGLTCVLNGGGTAYDCSGSLPIGTITPTLTGTVAGTDASITATDTLTDTTDNPNNGGDVADDNTPATLTVTVTPAADLSLTGSTTSTSPVPAGSPVTYTLTLTNNGPSAATATDVTGVIDNLTNIGVNTTDDVCTITGGDNLDCSGIGTLASGASVTITINGTAPDGDGAGTDAINPSTFTATADDSGSSQATVPTATLTVTPEADLDVVLTPPTNPAQAGTTATYTMTTTNNGPSTAVDVATVDTLPTGFTVTSTLPAGCSVSGDTLTCTDASLASGDTDVVTFSGTVPASGPMADSATVSATTNDPVGTNNAANTSTGVTPEADVTTSVSGPSSASPDAPVNYVYTVTNSGPSAATGTDLIFPIPAGLTGVSITPSGGVTCTLIDAGADYSCTGALPTAGVFNVTLGGTTPAAGGTVTATDTVTDTTDNPNDAGGTADTNAVGNTVTTTVAPQASLGLSSTPVTSANAGAPVTYTVQLTNGGPSSATNTVVSTTVQDLTGTITATSADGNTCMVTGDMVSCDEGTVVSGAGGDDTITITGTAPASGTIDPTTFTATADDSSNATTAVPSTGFAVTPEADLAVSITPPTTADAGSSVGYTVTVTNNGPSTASAPTVTENLPAGLIDPTLASGSPAGCSITGSTLTCLLSDLPSSGVDSIVVNGTVPASGSLADSASVSSTTADPNSANNDGTASTTITPVSDVVTTVSGPTTATSGTTVTYTVATTNYGPSTATGVVVTTTLPPSLTGATISGPGASFCSLSGTTVVTCTYPTLLDSQVDSITITATATTSGSVSVSSTTTTTTLNPNTSGLDATTVTAIAAAASVPLTGVELVSHALEGGVFFALGLMLLGLGLRRREDDLA